MNYYNPYFSAYPYYGISAVNPINATGTGLFSRLFGGFNFSNVLSGAQKTLNIANQAIPLIKQVQPMMHNARTMFKVMNEFKKVDNSNNSATVSVASNKNEEKTSSNNEVMQYETNGPTFFQ